MYNEKACKEKEIDLKDLIFGILYCWRKIVLWAIILGILMSGFQLGREILSKKNIKTQTEVKAEYEKNMEMYESALEKYEATFTEEGQRQRKCEDCGHIETESIPKLESNEDENSSDNEENKEDENNNGAANNNNNNNGTPGDVTDKTTANKTLPAAGLKTMFLPAVILVAIAVVSYRKYIKYKDI